MGNMQCMLSCMLCDGPPAWHAAACTTEAPQSDRYDASMWGPLLCQPCRHELQYAKCYCWCCSPVACEWCHHNSVLQLHLANLQRLEERLRILLHLVLPRGHCALGALETNHPAGNSQRRLTPLAVVFAVLFESGPHPGSTHGLTCHRLQPDSGPEGATATESQPGCAGRCSTLLT
jgi:hypothetical protein